MSIWRFLALGRLLRPVSWSNQGSICTGILCSFANSGLITSFWFFSHFFKLKCRQCFSNWFLVTSLISFLFGVYCLRCLPQSHLQFGRKWRIGWNVLQYSFKHCQNRTAMGYTEEWLTVLLTVCLDSFLGPKTVFFKPLTNRMSTK